MHTQQQYAGTAAGGGGVSGASGDVIGGGGGGGGDELVFDVTSTLGTALVVAVPAGCDADTLKRAVAAEHEQCHPEYGAVRVKQLYGLRPVPEGMGVSQWIAINTTALRHRSFTWLMAQLATSREVTGGMAEMEFASPVGKGEGTRGTSIHFHFSFSLPFRFVYSVFP